MTAYAYHPQDGWYTGEVADGSQFSTPQVPPLLTLTTTPGELRSRWFRYAWQVEPYPEPPAQPVAYSFDARNWYEATVPVGTPRSTRSKPTLFSTTTVDGEPRDRWDGGSWVTQPYSRPPRITKAAFQLRFPLMANGFSRKFDAMVGYVQNEGWAATVTANATDRYALQLVILTGLNRMAAREYVQLDWPVLAEFLEKFEPVTVPAAFRLSAAERAAVLSLTIQEHERYQ